MLPWLDVAGGTVSEVWFWTPSFRGAASVVVVVVVVDVVEGAQRLKGGMDGSRTRDPSTVCAAGASLDCSSCRCAAASAVYPRLNNDVGDME